MALIPVPILPGGSTHGLFRRLLFGADAIPLTASDFDNRPQAAIAAATANSPKVPSGILTRANEIWRYSKPEHQYSTYARYSPRERFEKEFGLTIATAFSNHILRARKNLKTMSYTQQPHAPPGDDNRMDTETVADDYSVAFMEIDPLADDGTYNGYLLM